METSSHDEDEPYSVGNAEVSDDEELEENDEIEEDESESDTEQQKQVHLGDSLDIDRILETELKRLTVSRQLRRKRRKIRNRERDSQLLGSLINKIDVDQQIALRNNDKQLQTAMDPVIYESMFAECCTAIAR
jgi:hypothetical protein